MFYGQSSKRFINDLTYIIKLIYIFIILIACDISVHSKNVLRIYIFNVLRTFL